MPPVLRFPREGAAAGSDAGRVAERSGDGLSAKDLAPGSLLLGLLLLAQSVVSAMGHGVRPGLPSSVLVSVALLAAAAWLHFRDLPSRWIHPLAFLLASLALSISLARVALAPTAAASLQLVLVVVASSMLFLSASWYAYFVALALVSWLGVGSSVYALEEWESFAPATVMACVLGVTIQIRRTRSLRRIAQIHDGLRRRADELEDAHDRALRSTERLAELSVRDPLTGCYNRRYLDQIQLELERPTAQWGCLMLDLDAFKGVNDRFGHEEGDRVLQGVAHFLRRQGRAEDRLARVGGDEFVFVMEVHSQQELDIIADRIERIAEREAPCPFSVGRAFRRPGEAMRDVVQRADSDMYLSKRGKRHGGRTLQMPRRNS